MTPTVRSARSQRRPTGAHGRPVPGREAPRTRRQLLRGQEWCRHRRTSGTGQRLRHPVVDRAAATNRPDRTMRRAPRDGYLAGVTSPNILIVMTDEERYPPPYETET